MRTIEYRVWDKEDNQYCFSSEKIVISQDGRLMMGGSDYYYVPDDDLYVVEQFTGLTDKNGEKIYEGDIVWLDYFGRRIDEKEQNLFQIIFHRGAFQLKPIKLSKPQGFGIGGGNHQFSHIVEIIGHDTEGNPQYNYKLPPPRPLSDFNICVVGGNIHENPELLT